MPEVVVQVGAQRLALPSLEEGWKRAIAVYQAGNAATTDVIHRRCELGEWLLGLYELTPFGKWHDVLALHGIHAKTAGRACKLAKARHEGLLDAALDRLADQGVIVSLRAVEIELGLRSRAAGVAEAEAVRGDTENLGTHGSQAVRVHTEQDDDDPESVDGAEDDLEDLEGWSDPEVTDGIEGGFALVGGEASVDDAAVEGPDQTHAAAAEHRVRPSLVAPRLGVPAALGGGEPDAVASPPASLPDIPSRGWRVHEQLTLSVLYEDSMAARDELDQLVLALSARRLDVDTVDRVRDNVIQIRRLITASYAAIGLPPIHVSEVR